MSHPNVFICDAARTPIGRYGGALSGMRPDDLAAYVIKTLVARNPGLDAERLDDVILGCANQAGEDNRNIARMALLLAGLPEAVPGVTINRLCASGAEAVAIAAAKISSGQADACIAGGVESMSRAPFVIGKADQPFSRNARLEDTTIGWRFINKAFAARFGNDPMPTTAENVADEFAISRGDQDEFAWNSQQRAASAAVSGYFAEEIAPIEVASGKSTTIMTDDEHPRPDTSLEALAKLKPVGRDGGTVTAGNSSGINDGAAALIIASEAAIARYGLIPRARVLGATARGVAPRLMGMGPVAASQALTERLGLNITDFDVIEINEAFASQVIACLRALGLSEHDDHVNRHGGAIALGHPLGMSGARLVQTAAHQLQQLRKGRALVTMCIGVGQGFSIALEAVA